MSTDQAKRDKRVKEQQLNTRTTGQVEPALMVRLGRRAGEFPPAPALSNADVSLLLANAAASRIRDVYGDGKAIEPGTSVKVFYTPPST